MAASAKALLARHKLPMDAATFHNGLILAGAMEIKTYLSTTGSGETKTYLSLTASGAAFGVNSPSGWHEIKTEPKYHDNHFAAAYITAAKAILEHAQTTFIKQE